MHTPGLSFSQLRITEERPLRRSLVRKKKKRKKKYAGGTHIRAKWSEQSAEAAAKE